MSVSGSSPEEVPLKLEHFHSQLVEAEGLSPLVKKGYGVNMAFLQISRCTFQATPNPSAVNQCFAVLCKFLGDF